MPAVRFAMSAFPGSRGDIWNSIVNGRLDWRALDFVQQAHFGFSFAGNTSDVIQRYIYFFGYWEPPLDAVISAYLQPGDTFVDVGANIGYFSLLAASRVGPNGSVYSFEAAGRTFAKLNANVQRNAQGSVIHAIHSCVADKDGTLTLHSGPDDNCGMASVLREGGTTEVVEAHPLGKLLPENALRGAKLIKVDVEGAEEMVVAGIEPDLPQITADFVVELSPGVAPSEGVLDVFARSGRHAYEVVPTDSMANYFAAPLEPAVRPLTSLLTRRSDILFSFRTPSELRSLGIACLPAE